MTALPGPALLDIDHFKLVNDLYGHQAGDSVLRQVAATIGALIRAGDSLGRYGGEEFIVLAPRTELDNALALASRIREGIAAMSFPLDSGEGDRQRGDRHATRQRHERPRPRLTRRQGAIRGQAGRAEPVHGRFLTSRLTQRNAFGAVSTDRFGIRFEPAKKSSMSTIPLDLETDVVVLPPPVRPRASLHDALRSRCSTRSFLTDDVPLQALSTILWAGFGVNREATGRRTAPSAHNWQEIDVFAVLAEGAYRYDARGNRLELVSAEDLSRDTGAQDFVATAPVNLVYVADFSRMTDVRSDDIAFLAGADAGCIAENVYLCCAALGLATVVRGLIDRRRLASVLGLTPTERIALAQTIRYPGGQ